MEKLTTYLKKLRFDSRLENSWIANYLKNPRLLILVILLIVLVGITSYINLPRNLNPEIKIPIVLIATALPGASPEDIERLVTIPIEDALGSVENIKKVTSSSQNSFSTVSLEFESGTDPDKAKGDVQSAVDGISDLPEDSIAPRVQKLDFERQPVWTFTLTGNEEASLMRFAEKLQERLENLASVDEVGISGFEEQEIQILLKPEAVTSYKLNPQILSAAIRSALSSLPAGALHTQNATFALTIDPHVTTINDIRKTLVTIDNEQIQLGDIAKVSIRSKPGGLASYFTDPQQNTPKRSVRFDIFRTKTSNIENTVKDAEGEVERSLEEYKNTFSIHTLSNVAEEVGDEFTELVRDFLITVSLVFIVLLLFLGIRQAIVAAISSPLTFLITFTVMNITGLALNFIAFFSLLLSLGLLVDDAIVAVSAMTAYYKTGKFTPLQTALLVWRDFLIPIFTTTITTVWAFVPLLLSTGIIGEFIKPIPIIVSANLIASFFIAMFVTLPLIILLLQGDLPRRIKVLLKILLYISPFIIISFLLPKNGMFFVFQIVMFSITLLILFRVRKQLYSTLISKIPTSKKPNNRIEKKSWQYYATHGLIDFSVIEIKYRNVLQRILKTRQNRRKSIFAVVAFLIFALALFPLGFVKNEFFPGGDTDFLYANLELPSGTYADITSLEARKILTNIKDTPFLEFATVDVGKSFNAMSGSGSSGGNTAQFTLVLKKKNRNIESGEIAQRLRQEFASYGKGKLTVEEVSGGPPAGADLQINLLGENLGLLDSHANKIQEYLEHQTGVTSSDKSIKPGTSKIVFIPDASKLASSNIDRGQLGGWIRTFASGLEIDNLILAEDGDESRDITIRLDEDTQRVTNLTRLSIPTQQGTMLPLSSIGHFELRPNPTVINREDGKRIIAVTAGVERGFNSADLNKNLEGYANSLNLPQGYSWRTGGANEENQQSVNSILQAMVLSMFLIITTMVIQFSSFRRALVVILVIPLSISGVFVIFALTQTPLSFPALIGVLALFGIVVKNSILIVDKIVANQKIGMDLTEAIVDASQSRLEAITLTSLCTIAGLIPITLSNPLWRGLGGAIIAGLTFSGLIMLFFIPVVYYIWYQDKEGSKAKKQTS